MESLEVQQMVAEIKEEITTIKKLLVLFLTYQSGLQTEQLVYKALNEMK